MSFGDGPCLGGGLLLASDSSDSGAAIGASVISQPSQGNCTCVPNPDAGPTPCSAPPGGPVPPPQPSTSENQIELNLISDVTLVPGLLVTCLETNVTLSSQCYTILFDLGPDGDVIPSGIYTLSTPGGTALPCDSTPPPTDFGAASLTQLYNDNPWNFYIYRAP